LPILCAYGSCTKQEPEPRDLASPPGIVRPVSGRASEEGLYVTYDPIRVGNFIRPGRPEPGRAVTGRPWMS